MAPQPQDKTANKPQEKYLSKSVRIAYQKGTIDCSNDDHFRIKKGEVTEDNPEGYSTVVPLSTDVVLGKMMPGVEATCECEKQACRIAWKCQDRIGKPTSEFVPYGRFRKGYGDIVIGKPAKLVCQSAYSLTKDECATLSSMYPGYVFFSTHDATKHDHAVSHTATDLQRRSMYDKLKRGTSTEPLVYLELHGSPNLAAQYNKRNVGVVIETMVEIKTQKDYLRALNWDARHENKTWFKGPLKNLGKERLANYSGIISIHTGYYYDDKFLDELFKFCPGTRLTMLMHRFEDSEGDINGDLHYQKYKQGSTARVRQVNTLGSDDYDHEDNASWFASNYRTLGKNGLTWSTNHVTPGTWVITATNCPPIRQPKSQGSITLDPLSTQQFVQDGVVRYKCGNDTVTVPITRATALFFEECRLWAGNTARTKKRFDSFTAKYKTLVCGVQAKYKIDSELAKQLAMAAFFIDCDVDADNISLMINGAVTSVETLQLCDDGVFEPDTMYTFVSNALVYFFWFLFTSSSSTARARARISVINSRNAINNTA